MNIEQRLGTRKRVTYNETPEERSATITKKGFTLRSEVVAKYGKSYWPGTITNISEGGWVSVTFHHNNDTRRLNPLRLFKSEEVSQSAIRTKVERLPKEYVE